MAKTNPIGEGKINVSVTLTPEMDTELRRLARASGVSRNRYCREILTHAAAEGITIGNTTHLRRKGKAS